MITFAHILQSTLHDSSAVVAYVYDCLKMGHNLGFSKFEISANV